MANIDSVVVKSQTGVDGNTYTTQVINDQLTNKDFLRLFLEELKSQDPTKPMDADKLLDNQLKMNQIQANNEMINSLKTLSQTYKTSLLANAVNFINKTIQSSEIGEGGKNLTYKITSVEQQDGEVILVGKKVTGIDDDGNPILDDKYSKIALSNVVRIF